MCLSSLLDVSIRVRYGLVFDFGARHGARRRWRRLRVACGLTLMLGCLDAALLRGDATCLPPEVPSRLSLTAARGQLLVGNIPDAMSNLGGRGGREPTRLGM